MPKYGNAFGMECFKWQVFPNSMNLELTVVGTASESLAHGPDFVVLVWDEGDGRGANGQ